MLDRIKAWFSRLWTEGHTVPWKSWVAHGVQAFGFCAATFYVNQWQGVSVEASYLNGFLVAVGVFGHREIGDLIKKLVAKVRGRELTEALTDGMGDFWSAVLAVALFVALHSNLAG